MPRLSALVLPAAGLPSRMKGCKPLPFGEGRVLARLEAEAGCPAGVISVAARLRP